ncbi:signal peptidase II, partial [bacterium]|nr:signal peptidase II [bacterium]
MNKKCLLLPLLIIVCDQVSKILIDNYLLIHQSKNIIGDFVKFTYILNPGGAFGTRFGGNLFYLVISTA